MTETTEAAGPQLRRAAALASGPTEVMAFLLPLWAAHDLGASPTAIGIVLAIESIISLIARPLVGVLADRIARRQLAASGAARARLSRRVIPVEGRTLRDGEPAGGVLIFVEHGFLSAIEHFWYEAMPATLPLASEMVVERSRVTHTERRFWRFRRRRREL